jgi:hypothetical protein
MEATMSTKKKRKSTKPRRPQAPPKFHVGDRVRVKYGIADPDFPDVPLGGWAGTITEVDQSGRFPMYLIEWNQSTLDNMHPVFRKRCERDGLEETSSWQGEEDIEADVGDPVPMEQPTNIVTRPLCQNDQDDRIRAIFGLTSDDPLPDSSEETLLTYHAHLSARLSFPFRAVYWRETGPFRSRKYTVSVTGLVDLDDYEPQAGYGLLCKVQHDADPKNITVVQERVKDRGTLLGFMQRMLGISTRQKEEEVEEACCWPLDEIEVQKGNPNRKLIADYSYWLHNH